MKLPLVFGSFEKILFVAVIIASVLFFGSTAELLHERELRKTAETELTKTRLALGNTRVVLTEIRALRRDIGDVNTRVETLAHQRAEEGEKRREVIRNATATDTCAAAPVPAAAADSLYKHASAISASAGLRATTGEPNRQD